MQHKENTSTVHEGQTSMPHYTTENEQRAMLPALLTQISKLTDLLLRQCMHAMKIMTLNYARVGHRSVRACQNKSLQH
jgi:hypothetical protein